MANKEAAFFKDSTTFGLMKVNKFSACLFAAIIYSISAIADSRKDSFDISETHIHLSLKNISSKSIAGYTELKIRSVSTALSGVMLDLLKLSCDSVFEGAEKRAFIQTDSQLTVLFSNHKYLNDSFVLRVFYHGQPQSDAQWGGFYFNGQYAFNMGVGFASIPHSLGRVWFPCVDDFAERSLFQFHITTDSGFMAVCNGMPAPATLNTDSSLTWHWYMNQPIPAYLASVAVSQYTLLTLPYQGKEKNFDIMIAAQAADTGRARASTINLGKALRLFEERFTPYPFERAGYVLVPFTNGAMEHATNISYPIGFMDGGLTYESVMAHELAHMWWGDLATCRTAQDMWLNEGWASYCEALFFENIYGKQAYHDDIKSKLMEVLRFAHAKDGDAWAMNAIPLQKTYGMHVYEKGALMAHALRSYMGDSAFFKACNSYLTRYRFTDVSSYELRDEFQKHTSVNITRFFDDWIFRPGFADLTIVTYEVTPSVSTNSVKIKVRQNTRFTGSLYANLPLLITVFSKDGRKELFTFTHNGYEQEYPLQVSADFIPAFVLLNENHLLPLACTYDMQTIKNTGSRTFGNGLLSINVQSIKDSARVLVEHHWTEAEQKITGNSRIRVSNYRYWRVEGDFDSSFAVQANFDYNGSTPSNFNGGWLDHTLNIANEDSVVLLYRRNASEAWTIHNSYNKLDGGNKTDKIGRLRTNMLLKGEYTIGKYDPTSSVEKTFLQEPEAKIMEVFPNPAQSLIYVSFNFNPNNGNLSIYDSSGRLLKSQNLQSGNPKTELSLSGLNPGFYILHFSDNERRICDTFVIE